MKKINEREELNFDILESIEFDLSEAIKDLFCSIKEIKKKLISIKEYLNI